MTALARTRDAEATRERILDAALEEFAAHGVAGARVNRIAERAQANKQLIYAYVGDKDALLQQVIAAALADVGAVALDPDDLPGYAGHLFDLMLAEPRLARLMEWAGLELVDQEGDGADALAAAYRQKADAVEAAQRDGRVDDAIAPVPLLALITAITSSWSGAMPALRALAGDPDRPEVLATHRAAVVEAVRRLVVPAER